MKKKYTYLIIIFLIVASCAAFSRIACNDFINFDDNYYITENNHTKSGINPESIKWAVTAVVASNWHPLTLISHMLDWNLFGANASGHHIVSLLLHIGAVIFVFLFLNKTTNNIWPSAFAAALFALHPLRVESVAWASERKDVLSMFFGMASIYAYAFYAESPRLSRYFLCLLLFALSLLSKSMLVTLPFVFLLLDYWPLRRWQKEIVTPQKNRFHMIGRLVGEKVPFIVLTIISSIMTVWAQYGDNSGYLPFNIRVLNAIISYVSYLGNTFWPVDLVLLYPFKYFFPTWQILVSCFILIGITIVVIYAFKKLPFLFVGWFWYLGTLVPVSGLVPVNQPMADHYTYLPSIGIAIMLAWGIPSLIKSEDIRKKILLTVGLFSIAILSFLTWHQCGYWKNSITLFSHVLQVTKDSYEAHNSRGNAYTDIGRYQQAIEDFNEAIRLRPDYANAYNNRGTIYAINGQYQLALTDFNKTISLQENHNNAYENRGNIYSIIGKYKQAIENYNKAISLKPDYANTYNNRGLSYFKHGYNKLGCDDVQKACELGNCKILEEAKSKGYCH